jgi:hypothetical protein
VIVKHVTDVVIDASGEVPTILIQIDGVGDTIPVADFVANCESWDGGSPLSVSTGEAIGVYWWKRDPTLSDPSIINDKYFFWDWADSNGNIFKVRDVE